MRCDAMRGAGMRLRPWRDLESDDDISRSRVARQRSLAAAPDGHARVYRSALYFVKRPCRPGTVFVDPEPFPDSRSSDVTVRFAAQIKGLSCGSRTDSWASRKSRNHPADACAWQEGRRRVPVAMARPAMPTARRTRWRCIGSPAGHPRSAEVGSRPSRADRHRPLAHPVCVMAASSGSA